MIRPPINFKNWIEKNRHLLKPPVGNQTVYDQGDFMIMVVGGPNSRKDYHVDPVEEFFFQIEGDMLLKVIENGKKINSQTLKLPSGKKLNKKNRELFEVEKIKTNVLKSEIILNQN